MVDFSKALNLVLRWFYRVIEVVEYIFRQKNGKKIFWNSRKNEFYGDFSCFFAIKFSAIPRHLSKLVQMMRLVFLNSQICLDSLALAGKKSYEFLKISKSQHFLNFFVVKSKNLGTNPERRSLCWPTANITSKSMRAPQVVIRNLFKCVLIMMTTNST